jgi:hypothetical protein
MPIIISLYDYTGEAVRPWAEQGYMCYCYDIQHPSDPHPNEDQVESVGKGGHLPHYEGSRRTHGIGLSCLY